MIWTFHTTLGTFHVIAWQFAVACKRLEQFGVRLKDILSMEEPRRAKA